MKLAFVVPRYGEEVLGGAETAVRQMAEHLPCPEFDVQVWTTCAGDLVSWRNVLAPGPTRVNGVPVLRFPIDQRLRDRRRYGQIMSKLTHGCPITPDEEQAWVDNCAHSPALYAHIARAGADLDLLVFAPYLAGASLYGASIAPRRSVLLPCLHDEPFAHLPTTRLMLEGCRGLWLMSEPERRLAREGLGVRNPAAAVVGLGFEDQRGDAARFRQRTGIVDPYLLYSGRFDSMKNLLELVAFFGEYKQLRPGPLKLVLRGSGPLPIPHHPDIVQIGFEHATVAKDAYAAAALLCQPSKLESFSIVLMEAWLNGTPALIDADCDVTRDHVTRCNGGLPYAGLDEFIGALDWLLAHPAQRSRMGQLGRAYVLREYNWQRVLDSFRRALGRWGYAGYA